VINAVACYRITDFQQHLASVVNYLIIPLAGGEGRVIGDRAVNKASFTISGLTSLQVGGMIIDWMKSNEIHSLRWHSSARGDKTPACRQIGGIFRLSI